MDYILGTQLFGSKLGLQNITELLRLLGNPQQSLKFIHVAGTNGKGSTTSMLTSILTAAGYKTGMYISPYVVCFNERISISGDYISDDDLAVLTFEVKDKVDEMVAAGENHPTIFEIITAIAMLYYNRQGCDYVVLEVGMGGRLDATNVIENPLVSVITAISFDHMQYLGDTIDKITFEKCGIIKKNGVVVSYPLQEDAAVSVIENVCDEKNARLIIADVPQSICFTDHGNTFDCRGYGNVKTSLAGEFQAYNAATVLAVVDTLINLYGVKINRDAIYKGIANTTWPCRFEIVDENPIVVLDGGHNLAGIEVFKESVIKLAQGRAITLVMGMLEDREYPECVGLLAPIVKNFIAVHVQRSKGEKAEKIAEFANGAEHVYVKSDPIEAYKLGTSLVGNDEVLAVVGSLYLVSDVRNYIKGGQACE